MNSTTIGSTNHMPDLTTNGHQPYLEAAIEHIMNANPHAAYYDSPTVCPQYSTISQHFEHEDEDANSANGKSNYQFWNSNCFDFELQTPIKNNINTLPNNENRFDLNYTPHYAEVIHCTAAQYDNASPQISTNQLNLYKCQNQLLESIRNIEHSDSSTNGVGVDNSIFPKLRSSQRSKMSQTLRKQNQREQDKNRTRALNVAFCHLRSRLPEIPKDTKLTKIRTLHYAIAYIKQMMEMIHETDSMIVEANQRTLINKTLNSDESFIKDSGYLSFQN